MMRLPGYSRRDRGYRHSGRPVVALIGSREMPAQCAQMLIEGGFDLATVHSPDAPLRDWCEAKTIDHIADFALFRNWVETIAIDYLFSILNFKLLPASLIEAPLVCAINYHDAPLPKYAGSHATAWALHNGEHTHGVSWHIMHEQVDAGDLLKQVVFPIPQGTTQAVLDQRCYLAAMRAFKALLPELLAESFTRTPQDLTRRTFYPRSSRPPGPILPTLS